MTLSFLFFGVRRKNSFEPKEAKLPIEGIGKSTLTQDVFAKIEILSFFGFPVESDWWIESKSFLDEC